jgi:hypothetical protein
VANRLDQDAVKRRQRAQQVAQHRYQLDLPGTGTRVVDEARAGIIVRGIAGWQYDGPFGSRVSYSQSRWLGESAGTTPAGSTRWYRHCGNPAPGSTRRSSNWPPR